MSAMTWSWCGGEDAVGQADAHHEELGGFAFAADAAGGADAIALGVDAPPLEVEAGPGSVDVLAALSGVLTHFVPGFPGVLGELQALGFLGLGFLDLACGGCGEWSGRNFGGRDYVEIEIVCHGSF